MTIARLLAVGCLIAGTMGSAEAQDHSNADAKDYPNRAIHMIVPFPPGGAVDVMARLIGQRMSEDWAQPVMIENRTGANTALGAVAVAKAVPDGYTLLTAMDTTLVTNPITTPNLSYNPSTDFTFVCMLAKGISLLMVRGDDGPKTVQELIARAKANPGKLNYGAGIIPTRLAGYLFNREAGIDVRLIPYKGSADVVQGLLTGSVDYIVDGVISSLALINSGKFRALAKLNSLPLAVLPDVQPLSVITGFPALDDISSWTGMVAPAGTPRPIVDKIQREIELIYADPIMQKKFADAALVPRLSTPEEFELFVKKEAVRWNKLFRESNIQLE